MCFSDILILQHLCSSLVCLNSEPLPFWYLQVTGGQRGEAYEVLNTLEFTKKEKAAHTEGSRIHYTFASFCFVLVTDQGSCLAFARWSGFKIHPQMTGRCWKAPILSAALHSCWPSLEVSRIDGITVWYKMPAPGPVLCCARFPVVLPMMAVLRCLPSITGRQT